ncbi:hypothetical protein EDB85DRAFT_1894481 [Lactarius pseudohatsudake]|nr:hypothetical protein EDB85DRAFT_1894481 [Lactarius pseudohatsudake]
MVGLWSKVEGLLPEQEFETKIREGWTRSKKWKCNRSRSTEQQSVEDVLDVDIGWCDGASESRAKYMKGFIKIDHLVMQCDLMRVAGWILCIINKPTAAATITTMVLGKVKETTRAYLGKGTVMVVACLFNTEHQATKDTSTLQAFRSSTLSTTLQQLPSPMDLTRPPSLQILCITNEPTAATVTQGLDKRLGHNSRWHRESRLKRWGGHLTIDFHKENGVHVTTHHVYPTEAAYGSRKPRYNHNTPTHKNESAIIECEAKAWVSNECSMSHGSRELCSGVSTSSWKPRYNRNTPTHKNKSTIIKCEAEAQVSDEYPMSHGSRVIGYTVQ